MTPHTRKLGRQIVRVIDIIMSLIGATYVLSWAVDYLQQHYGHLAAILIGIPLCALVTWITVTVVGKR